MLLQFGQDTAQLDTCTILHRSVCLPRCVEVNPLYFTQRTRMNGLLEEKNRKANEKKKSPSNKSGTDQMMLEEDKEEGGGQCVLGCGWMVSMHLQALIVC